MICVFVARIVGGEEVKPHTLYWQVAVYKYIFMDGEYDFNLVCGGSIISNEWVVSASHCFYNCPHEDTENCDEDYCPYEKENVAKKKDFYISFGLHDLSKKNPK